MKENRKPKSQTKSLMAALEECREAMRPFWETRHEVEARECPPRLERLRELGVNIEQAGGNCPVQIEGHVKGKPFYFRARGDHWSLGIGGDPVMRPAWGIDRPYGEWPEAGWMPLHEAYDFLIEGVEAWRAQRKAPRGPKVQ